VSLGTEAEVGSKPAKVTLGNSACPSRCEPFRQVILEKVELGLSAQRIWQDLVDEHAFTASYSSVKRFVRRLRKTSPLPFRRMECEPGEQGQLDFGRGAPVVGADGKRRVPHLFRIVLSHSRKGYSEAVFRQRTEDFIRVLENAFRQFGGAPKTLVIDNLRAAVKKADWFDPELNPKVEAFCRHYGVVILPTKPYMPRHKGKVERGIGYTQGNALKGRVFSSLAEENRHLAQWERQVADHRIHGTTRKQVRRVFEEVEKPALLPLPPGLFPFFHEAQRVVHRDGHIEIERAYYSVPPEYLGHTLWVRWDSRLVRVFNERFEQIAVHVKREEGRFSTAPQHIASEKISAVERGATWLLKRVHLIGRQAAQWAEAMVDARGIQGVRVLQGLLSLARKYPCDAIEKACESALSHGIFRLRGLRELLKEPTTQEQFLQQHRVIRPMSHYGWFVRVSFREEEKQEEENASIALEADGREQRRESPEPARTFPAVRLPDPALGSLASGALSSEPAPDSVVRPDTRVNEQGDARHERHTG
jgi:transposase